MTTTFAIIILVAIAIALALLVAVRASIAAVASRVQQQLFENADHTGRIEAQSRQLKVSLEKLDRAFGEDATRARNEGVVHLRQVREALAADLKSQADELAGRVDRLGSELQQREGAVRQYLERVDAALERHGRATAEEAARTRGEAAAQARLMREEVTRHIKGHGDVMTERVAELTVALRNQQYDFHQQVGLLTQATERRMTELQQVFEKQLRRFEDGVDGRLEQMRAAVDEQVQATMDRGLGETFRDVRAQLESVQQNLKEMQQLASNVSDFRRVLTNVSSRGSWGVVRLSSLLEQSLSAGQYAADVKTKRDSDERVKFAVRLPGREAGDDRPVWLPIDAGFPLGAYQRLISARDGGDATEIDTVGAALENALTVRARAVGDKFLDPPFTTDFAVMFLPVEGLYAEVLRRQGLAESLQRECRVVVCGPTTLAALLNSLQMGFRTLAIEQRSIEVWRLLGAVRTQFDSFGRVLGAVQAKLQEASTSISAVETDARAIQERLQDVPVLPVAEAWSRPASVLPALETDDDEAVPEPAAVVPAEPVAVEHPTDPA